MYTILVGIDGSTESRNALRWTVDEARLRGGVVQAVYAYDYEPAWRLYEYAPHGPFSDVAFQSVPDQWEQEAAAAEDKALMLLKGVLHDLGDAAAGVTVDPLAVRDRRPANALVQLSHHADLLVVGSRGRGGFSGLLLGSCSQQCAQHAACPVVIVRSDH